MLESDPRSGDTGGGGRRRALSFLPVFAAGNFGRNRHGSGRGATEESFPKIFAFVRNAARPQAVSARYFFFFFCKSPFSESEVFLRRCRARSFASLTRKKVLGARDEDCRPRVFQEDPFISQSKSYCSRRLYGRRVAWDREEKMLPSGHLKTKK